MPTATKADKAKKRNCPYCGSATQDGHDAERDTGGEENPCGHTPAINGVSVEP